MPKLRGENIARPVGTSTERSTAGEGELVVGCPLVRPCDWETVRPFRAVHSAQEAHVIRHHKGMA